MRRPRKTDMASPHRHGPAATPLRVVNGDLSFVRGTIVVGHFLGDSIAGAEAQLDFTLAGALKRRYALGAYPGPVGSAVFVPALDGSAAAGVVVGLGDIGSLSAGAIRAALVAGLLELGVAGGGDRGGVALVALGSRAGSVSLSDTVAAMLAAISEAQRRLAEQGLQPLPEVQLLSVYEDEAHQLWHHLRRHLAEPRYRGQFRLEDEIVYAAGAQKRLVRAEDSGAWQAVQVVADGAAGEARFRFTASGGRARADGFAVGADPDFLQRFLAAAQNRHLDSAPTRALFQLIWPAELRQASRDDVNLRLILDASAAALPFELMDDRPQAAAGADQGPPPAVRHGMLRQLIQTRFARLQPTPPGRRRALVIGDPRGGPPADDFAELPGAREEAEAIARLLEAAGFEVVRLIGDDVTPDQVVERVLEGGWTVLHVSAHGIYNYAFRSDRLAAKAAGWDDRTRFEGPRHTGIVLGDKLTLSPAVLQGMPEPPVLAFVNCCDLGTVRADDETKLSAAGRPQFAASFAGELIALGTRAVIAAGWEVSDKGAVAFARALYGALLDDALPFGDAVRIARGAVFAADQEDATWGAYQCYGEPDWRLRTDADPAPRRRAVPVFASPAEAIARLEGLCNLARVGGERPRARADLLAELGAVEQAVKRRGWEGRDGVAEQIGRALAALGEEERAIGWFEEALKSDSAPSLGAVETLARLRLRQACRDEGKEEAPGAALARIEAIREQLTFLCAVAGPTPERLSLIGRAADRAAQLARGAERDTELARMRDAYRQAGKLARAREAGDPFEPAVMAATAGVLLALRTGADPAECRGDIEALAGLHDGGAVARRLLEALLDRGLSPEAAAALAAEVRQAESEPAGAPLAETIRLVAAVLTEGDAAADEAQWIASLAPPGR